MNIFPILQVLYVDDDEALLEQTKEILSEEVISLHDQQFQLEVITNSSFENALPLLQRQRFDLLILDVRLGSYDRMEEEDEEVGRKTYELIKQHCFVPIVFYTGLPGRVRFLESSLVQVVEKTERSEGLLKAFLKILETRIPEINRSLVTLFEEVKRDYLWKFVESHWQNFASSSQDSDLAYLLARRIAASLSEDSLNQLFNNNDDRVHPLRYYVMPPISPSIMAGDLYQEMSNDEKRYFIVLTPSCDLYENHGRTRKADVVLLAQCLLLTSTPEYSAWTQNPSSNGTKGTLRSLLSNGKSDRYYYLPRAIQIPDLVIDFQALKLTSFNRIKEEDDCERIASLDSPFAEAVLNRFSRYVGRLGTPELDININFPGLQR